MKKTLIPIKLHPTVRLAAVILAALAFFMLLLPLYPLEVLSSLSLVVMLLGLEEGVSNRMRRVPLNRRAIGWIVRVTEVDWDEKFPAR